MIRPRLLVSLLGALLAATLGLACAELPEGARYLCEVDTDCPEGQRCGDGGLCAAADAGPLSRDAGRPDATGFDGGAEEPGPDAEVPGPDASAAGPDAGGGPDAAVPGDAGCPATAFACAGGCCPYLGSISAAGDTTCAVKSNGDVYCWGDLSERRLGPWAGDAGAPAFPVKVGSGAVEVAVGRAICVRRVDGRVECWGGSEDPSGAIVERATAATAIGLGPEHGCAATETAGVVCWGAGDPLEAEDQPGLGGATRLALGERHSCALVEGGAANEVYCWGRASFTTFDAGAGEPCRMSVVQGSALAIASGPEHVCAASHSEETLHLTCWGSSAAEEAGVLGIGGNGIRAEDLASARTHNCLVGPDRGVQCWGSAPYEAVGVTTEPGAHNRQAVCTLARAANQPCPADTALGEVAAVVAGARHSCARRFDGKVYCWGENAAGQLGFPGATSAAAVLAIDLGP